MNRIIDFRLLSTSFSLKLSVAITQVITSILYFRNMGAEDYGKIIAFVASIELILLLSIPGVAKVCLKHLANDKFPLNSYKLKIILVTIIMIITLFYVDDIYYLCIGAILCLDNINSLNRTSLALRRKFNLLISLDLLRPLLSISLIILAWYNEYNVEIELYVLSMALSMCIETLIIIPFVINSYRILPSSPHTFKALASEAALASGFSYSNTLTRKLPVITAGSLLPELTALTSIFMQFFTLMNYIISTLMMQISLSLLKREISNKSTVDIFLSGNNSIKLFLIFVYILTLIFLDQSKSMWLAQIFSYGDELYYSMFALSFLPVVSFFLRCNSIICSQTMLNKLRILLCLIYSVYRYLLQFTSLLEPKVYLLLGLTPFYITL